MHMKNYPEVLLISHTSPETEHRVSLHHHSLYFGLASYYDDTSLQQIIMHLRTNILAPNVCRSHVPMLKEAVMAKSKVLSQHLPGRTEEKP
jgi:hypothetical protein